MAKPAPEFLYPLRLSLHVPQYTTLRFSILDFPFGEAFDHFMARFSSIYKRRYNTDKIAFEHWPPFRQLNDAVLALAPGLVQGFEKATGNKLRMATFTRYKNGNPVDFPEVDTLRPLVNLWLQRWASQPKIQILIAGEAADAWAEVIKAVKTGPGEKWQHGIDPQLIVGDFDRPGGKPVISPYVALPSLLVGLLHNQKISINRGTRSFGLVWRRVNDGGKNGLHLVSQPIRSSKEDYFAYRLDFSVQTQVGLKHEAGIANGWIFAHLSIQRYITETFKHLADRDVSVLVGHNRERFSSGWDSDTTLIRLPVSFTHGAIEYESGVGGLLDDYAMRPLVKPEMLFAAPGKYGAFDSGFEADDEYYVVYAEGRKFGDGQGRQHRVLTGTRLHERAQIMYNMIDHLQGWLRISSPLIYDVQRPNKLYSLYTYHKMRQNDKNGMKAASWREMLTRSLANSDNERAHVIVLQQHERFMRHAPSEINAVLLGAGEDTTANGTPPIQTDYITLPASLYHPLDPGTLDPELIKWDNRMKRPEHFWRDWKKQMAISRDIKLRSWCDYLDSLHWAEGARRLLLIDSTGETDTDKSRHIKGIIREACSLKGVASQFIVGRSLKDQTKNQLKAAQAKIRNAALDLLVRQQSILYGPPSEMYAQASELPVDLASRLDVIAFCRVRLTKPIDLQYALAVRLRADGVVDVSLPNRPDLWLPYPLAANAVGQLFAQERVALQNEQRNSPLRLRHPDLLSFVHAVLVENKLERPTLAIVEAEGWRNGPGDEENMHCWTQLRNSDLGRSFGELHLGKKRYQRDSPLLEQLMGVVRLRMDKETPQYLTTRAGELSANAIDVPHLTGYVDSTDIPVFHYYSVAGLPESQKNQPVPTTRETFKMDVVANRFHDVAVKHPQIIEMVPFFVHPRLQNGAGMRALCRAVHFLRVSPSFTMGDIVTPYPMHLGEKLIRDQLVIIDASL